MNYIVFDDGRVGYIDNICWCKKCKQREMPEIFINDLEGKYLECIKTNDVSDIIYVGNHYVKQYQTSRAL